jgi:hypothetical protein
MADSDKAGRLEYKLEGFGVNWDEQGLKICTLDYHVGCLNLSWETILDLSQRAGAGVSYQSSQKYEKAI